MAYTGTTNYGFQKPAKENAFTVDDLTNALDKIDETIKARDDAQNTKNTEQDTAIANNDIDAISVDLDSTNNLKVELTKGDGSKISGNIDLSFSGEAQELSYPKEIVIDRQWYTVVGFEERFRTDSSGQITYDSPTTVNLKRITYSSGQLEDMTVFDKTSNKIYKIFNPTKITYSNPASFSIKSEISTWSTSGSRDKDIEDLKTHLEHIFLNRYTNLSEVFVGTSNSLSTRLIRVPLTVDSSRKITAIGTLSAVSSTTSITNSNFDAEELYRIWMDTGANTSDGKQGYIASEIWNQDIPNPFADNMICLSPNKLLYTGSITDLIKVRNASDTSNYDGYIHIPKEFDIEYIHNYNRFKVTVPAIPYTPCRSATYFYLGQSFTKDKEWVIYISILDSGGTGIIAVKYANGNISQIIDSLSNNAMGYRLFV